MSVYRPKGRENYSFNFIIRGHRFSGSTGTANKREAERFESDLKKAKQKELEQAATFTASGPMTLEIAASRYWIEVAQHLANSEDAFRYLGWLESHFGKTQRIDKITDSMVAAMVAKRRGEDVSNATVNRSATGPLRAVLSRAKKAWKVPVADIDWSQHWLKEQQERIREASRDEETKLLDAMRADYAPALRFALLTGCRRAEIVNLTWSRVDWFNKVFVVTGKGDKTRVIPMTTPVYELLWSLKDHHATAVFTYVVQATRKHLKLVRGERRPITMEGFKTAWRRYKKDAGVENFRFHDTRHTAATRTLRSGNLKIVQRMLGHEDIATTAKYAHAMVEDVRAAMEAASHIPSHIQGGAESANDLKENKKPS